MSVAKAKSNPRRREVLVALVFVPLELIPPRFESHAYTAVYTPSRGFPRPGGKPRGEWGGDKQTGESRRFSASAGSSQERATSGNFCTEKGARASIREHGPAEPGFRDFWRVLLNILSISGWRPQRDSNPRFGLERATSWASGRWGLVGRRELDMILQAARGTLRRSRSGSVSVRMSGRD